MSQPNSVPSQTEKALKKSRTCSLLLLNNVMANKVRVRVGYGPITGVSERFLLIVLTSTVCLSDCRPRCLLLKCVSSQQYDGCSIAVMIKFDDNDNGRMRMSVQVRRLQRVIFTFPAKKTCSNKSKGCVRPCLIGMLQLLASP